MKIKKLIWAFAAILGIAACTTEMPVDNEEKAPLSVVLSVEKTETKAIGDSIVPYIEEVKVNRYHVALFNSEGERIAHAEYDGEGLLKDESFVEISPKYKAHFDNIPEGFISVYVIANYPSTWKKEDFKNEQAWGTYSLYQQKSVVTDPFTATDLVKVGYKEEVVTASTRRIELALVQLTAGIDVVIKQVGDPGYVEGIPLKPEFVDATGNKEYIIDNEADIDKYVGVEYLESTIQTYLPNKDSDSKWASFLMNDAGGWNNYAITTWFANQDGVSYKTTPERGALYYRGRLQNGADSHNTFLTDVKIIAYGRDVDCYVKVPVTGTVTSKSMMSGLNKESDIAIYRTEQNKPENTKYQKAEDVSSFNNRFYTYEPGLNVLRQDLVLSVEVGRGTNFKVYYKKYRQYGYKIYRGSWVNDVVGGTYTWETTKEGFPKFAWLPVTEKDGDLIDPGTGEPVRTEPGTGELTDIKIYSLTIPTDKIVKGHIYHATGTYTPSINVTPTMVWEVEGWENRPVDIPDFK